MTRDEAIKILSTKDNQGMPITWQNGFVEAYDMAIEALERKRGDWVDKWHRLFKEELPMCSVCNNFSLFKNNYCPNCGADMRERREDVD